VLFVGRSLTYRDPIVDLRAFGERQFTVGCMISFIIGIGMYCSIYLVPVFLSNIRGYDAFQIGTTVFVTGVFQILATFIAVALRKRLDVRVILLIGFGTCMLSFHLFGQIGSDWGRDELFVPQALRGLGTMLCVIPITGVALGGLSPLQLKGASGLFNLMRNLGGAIGLALVNTELFYNRLHLHYNNLNAHLGEAHANGIAAQNRLAGMLAGRFVDSDRTSTASLKLIDRLLTREALTLSFADVYLLLGGVFALGAILIVFIETGKKADKAHSSASLQPEH